MSNTIELLETIGRNASLRHASGDDLAQNLIGMQASPELLQAATSGDSTYLEKELGHRNMKSTKNPTQGGYEEDDDDDDDEENEGSVIPGQSGNGELDHSSK